MNCNQINYRYFDFTESRVLLRQIGTKVQQIKRDDVLWIAIDTSNVMMQRTNGLSHYHGTFDGLDILIARPEYTDFTENGRIFSKISSIRS